MKYIIFIILLFNFFIKHCNANNLIIKNVTVVNPVNNNSVESLKHQWVEIIDGRIKRISKTPIENDNSIPVLDGSNKYLIPGLMDSHVHTGNMPGLRDDFVGAEKLQKEFLEQQPRSYLYYGITQILDPSRTPQQVDLFEQEQIKPDMFFCGAVPIVGGYNLLEADLTKAIKTRKYFVFQPGRDGLPPKGFNPENHTPEMVVKRMAEDGAKCVKVYTEDGFDVANNWPSISLELLKRVRKAATKHGLKMMAHANAVDMQKVALEAKVDILGHGLWNWLNFKSKTGLPAEVKTVADKIIKRNTVYQPTLNVMRSLRDVMAEDHLAHPDYKNVLSAAALDWYQTEDGQWFSKVMSQGWGERNSQQIHQHMSGVMTQGERVLQYLYKNGHPMVLATDTPPAPTYASQPGLSANWELKNMHRLGVSLSHLLTAATINNAKAFDLHKDYGSVTVGKVGNLLLLNSNPLDSLDAYDDINTVILHGVTHNRNKLSVN